MNSSWLKNFILSTLKIYGVGLVLGFCWRLFFWALFYTQNDPSLFKAFFLGARFDLTVLCYVQSIPILLLVFAASLHLIGFEDFVRIFTRHFHKFLFYYWGIFGFFIFWMSASDIGFYSYYQDRINMIIFGFIEDDTIAVIKTMWKNYPLLKALLATALYTYTQTWFLKKLWDSKISFELPRKNLKQTSLAICTLSFIFLINGLGGRGSLGLFPLSEMDTHISKTHFINLLSWNPLHALSKAVQARIEQKSNWDSNLRFFGFAGKTDEAFSGYFHIEQSKLPMDRLSLLRQVTPPNEWAKKIKPHVVLVVLESFGAHWSSYTEPDFNLLGNLKQHFTQDFFSPNLISATSGTIGSVTSLMVGTPQRNIAEFLTESPFMTTRFESSAAITYKNAGYSTHFVYGGNPGWRNINTFAHRQGFDSVEGESDIKETLQENLEAHDWGVYDHDLFRYVSLQLEKATTPQFYMILTTSNHPPYQLPSGYQPPPMKIPESILKDVIGTPEMALQRFQVFRYAAESFAQFVNGIKKSILGDKTILAATGDHSFWLVQFPDSQIMKKFAVPFYLYLPKDAPHPVSKKQFNEFYGSHADILPTIYEASLDQSPYISISKSFLNPNRVNLASGYSRLVANPQGIISVGKSENENICYQWTPDRSGVEACTDKHMLDANADFFRQEQTILDLFYKDQKDRSARSASK